MNKFKVGDIAFSLQDGFGEVRLHTEDRSAWHSHCGRIYDLNGYRQFSFDEYPTLLTVEEAAKLGYYPPKKKVTKEIVGWVNVYEGSDTRPIVFESKEKAEQYRKINYRKSATVEVRGTYEVEE